MRKSKLFNIILFLIVAVVALFVVGCDEIPDDGSSGYIIEEKVLAIPGNLREVEYDGVPVVFFDSVENAKSYQINIYNSSSKLVKRFEVSEQERVLGKTITGLQVGVYQCDVRAMAQEAHLNSDFSPRIEIVVKSEVVSDTKYTIVFDSAGGSTVPSQIVSEGNYVSIPATPVRVGYTFAGWYINGKAYNFSEPVKGEFTLVAKWSVGGSSSTEELTGYYASASGLSGNALKLKLREIISNKKYSTSYDDLRYSSKGLPYTDADPTDPSKIIYFYSRASESNKWTSGNTWNREHVWPKSLGWYKNSGAGSDIHHLRPEDSGVNSTRGNYKMGIVTNPTKTIMYNGKSAGKIGGGYFEPLDCVKGDVARIYMYMMVCYSQTDSSYPVTKAIESISLMLSWHELDPVDQLEIVRNERAYEIQGNRNPFIDHPELARLIWK